MLKEEQAAELLRRCEAIVGRELKQIRGNLRKASTRAEAVWELIVVEAAAQLGSLEYESTKGGPDIRLELPSGRWMSIEVTYLHPRFENEERRSAMVVRWLHEALATLGVNSPEIKCEFNGDKDHPAGPKRTLPLEQERKQFLASTEVSQFLSAVLSRPNETHKQQLTDYSVTLFASPRAPGSLGFLSWGGLLQEAPKKVNEHAAFRAIRSKIQQHKVDEPHLVCIGSDISPVLSSTMQSSGIRLEHALEEAVSKSGELSGVLVVNIEQAMPVLHNSITRTARCTIYPVKNCRHPLTEEELAFIQKLDLNRWKYSFPLPQKDALPQHRPRYITGSLGLSSTPGGTVKISIPAPVLVDLLAGRKQLLDDYGGKEGSFGNALAHCLQEGWSVVSCSFQDGDIQQAKAALVVLELAPPYPSVFWPKN